MHSIRAGAVRPLARVGAIATPLAVIAMLVLPNAAFAATTIGSTPAIPLTSTCSLGFDFVQASTGATSPSYVVPPGGGTITDWTTMTGPSLGQIGLEVWRLTTGPATYTLVGASPLVTPLAINTLTTSTLTLATQIPVLAGDLLGLRLEGPATCFQPGSAGDTLGYFVGPNPVLLSTETMLVYPLPALLNVSATVGTTPPPPPPPPPPGTCDQTGDQNGDQNGDQTGDQTAQMPDRSNNDHVADASTVDKTGDQAGDHTSSWSGDRTASSRGDKTGDSTGDSKSGDQTSDKKRSDDCNQGTTAD